MNEALEHVLLEVNMLPDEEQRRIARVIENEMRKARHETPPPAGRWARLAERLSKESPLEGRSDALLQEVRELREGFAMLEPGRTD